MAAFDTPWTTSMSSEAFEPTGGASKQSTGEAPVFAAFSPSQSPSSSTSTPQRSTILVHQKSPLLVATPPQITRALAYSYTFIQPLNKVAGLLSWTTNDPWESFLLLCAFWVITLYGDIVVRTAGPLVFAACLVLGMYARRRSTMSSTMWSRPTNEAQSPKKGTPQDNKGARHHRSLDEIVAALQLFTSRCNILLDPLLRLTDFLSTQTTATSATTRPALTALFLRLLMLMPIWFTLTLAPLRMITTKRVVFVVGTLILSWHSRPARVFRIILWRSRTIRRLSSLVTGLSFSDQTQQKNRQTLQRPAQTRGFRSANDVAASLAASRREPHDKGTSEEQLEGIQFTFGLFENQRRWIGIGWTGSMLAYERAAWTDEQLNTTESTDRFELPAVEGSLARWQWCKGSQWQVDPDFTDDTEEGGDHKSTGKSKSLRHKGEDDEEGWVYYDNKWLHGRRGIDGWGRYTRRRRWVRNAELVEVPSDSSTTPRKNNALQTNKSTPVVSTPFDTQSLNPATSLPTTPSKHQQAPSVDSTSSDGRDKESIQAARKRNWFRRRRSASNTTDASSATAVASEAEGSAHAEKRWEREKDQREDGEDDGYVPMEFRGRQGTMESNWGVGEDAGMDLG